MDHPKLLIILAVAAVTLAVAALLRRRSIPTPVVLVVAGLVIGFLPFVPDATLDPDVVLIGLLPLIVYHASFVASPRAFLRNAAPIGFLAVGLVVVSAGAVAAVAHWLGHLSWPMAFVLGTTVGPTDAVAATSIAGRLGLPQRLVTILEGEALFNDGTALVLYAEAVHTATSGHFSVLHTLGSIVYGVVIGTAVGLLVGLAGRWARQRVDDPPIEIILSLLMAYAAYIPAETVGASGVLAAVTAGLYLGWHSSGSYSARSRLQSAAFWDTLSFLIDAGLFVLVGLSFHSFTAANGGPVGRLALTSAAVFGAVVLIRLFWVFLVAPLRRLWGGGPAQGPHWREASVVGWSGMRGAVTLAAVLAVPVSLSSGGPLEGRSDVVYLGFAVILGTLVAQGLTLPFLVRRARLAEHPSVAEAERLARAELAQVALRTLHRERDHGSVAPEAADALRAQFRARLRSLDLCEDDDVGADVDPLATDRVLRQHILMAQRAALLELRDGKRIGSSTMRILEHELDLDEARLR